MNIHMKQSHTLSAAGATLLASAMPFQLAAQRSSGADEAAGCFACGMVMMVPAIIAAIFAASVAMLVWVARDAKNRGMDNAVVWMLFVFLANVIGLIVYIFSRPQGNLVRCANCRNKRLQVSTRCPHCSAA